MIQDMNDNQDNKTAKVHGSGSMYVDAAIEALIQARKEEEDFSYLLITNRGDKCGQMAGGKLVDICSAIASQMEINKNFKSLIKGALLMYECHKNPKEMLNKFMGIIDKATKESKENPSDALKGFFDKLDKDKEE